MSDFIKRLKDLANKRETYKSSDIEVRVKQNPNGRDVFIYKRKKIDDNNPYKSHIKAINIEDEKDCIEYKLIALPGGRLAFGGYLYPEDLDTSKMSFYSFNSYWYTTFGETVSFQREFTIDELKGILQIFRSRTEITKYQWLYEIRYKPSFKGKRKFEGSKFFAGTMKGGSRQFEQIEGEDNIKLEEKPIDYDTTALDINLKVDQEKTVNLGKEYGYVIIENDNTPFEIISLNALFKRSRVYDEPYFTKEALSKIVKEREKERGI